MVTTGNKSKPRLNLIYIYLQHEYCVTMKSAQYKNMVKIHSNLQFTLQRKYIYKKTV